MRSPNGDGSGKKSGRKNCHHVCRLSVRSAMQAKLLVWQFYKRWNFI